MHLGPVPRFLRRSAAFLFGRTGFRHREQIRRSLLALEQRRHELRAFGSASDREFTALARGLANLTSRLTEVHRQSERLSNQLNDRDEDRALSSAYATYKNSVDLVHSSVGIAISEQEQMHGVEKRLQRILDVRETFKRNSLMFRMLAMGIRLEAARLDEESQRTFLNVSGAIAEIEQRMFATTEAAFERIELVTDETAQEREQLGTLQNVLHARAQHSIRTLQDELGKVQIALRPCADESGAIEELMTQIEPHTTRVITALQYQDIVRQKLEHVALGFGDLAGHATGPDRLDLAYVHQAAQIQATQVNRARADIGRAASEITGGMADLAAVAEMLLTRFNAMNGTAARAFGDCRIATLFQDEIRNLSQIVQQSEQTNQKLSRLVDRIEQIVDVFAHEIGKHEFDVRLVALNAQIAAARLSSADALNKLAEESIHVSDENARGTQALATGLAETLTLLREIKREAADFLRVVTTEKVALENNAVLVGGKLHRLTEGAQQTASEMNRDFVAAHDEMARLVDDIRFPQEIDSACSPAAQLCLDLVRQTDANATAELGDTMRLRLAEHQKRYTMTTERESHASSIAERPSLAAPPNSPASDGDSPTPVAMPAASSSSELGDGIELF